MSDRYPASIVVGGPLKRADMDEFLSAVCGDSPSHTWGDAPLAIGTEKDLLEYVNNGHEEQMHTGFFYACDDQARNGMFEEIEVVCRELGLSYDRYSDAYSEWSGEAAIYRPPVYDGAGPIMEFFCSQSEKLLVEYETVRKAIDALRSDDDVKAKEILEALAPDYPAISKFEIID